MFVISTFLQSPLQLRSVLEIIVIRFLKGTISSFLEFVSCLTDSNIILAKVAFCCVEPFKLFKKFVIIKNKKLQIKLSITLILASVVGCSKVISAKYTVLPTNSSTCSANTVVAYSPYCLKNSMTYASERIMMRDIF
ncbi:hypothetical protein V1478_005330 [Vespula squamosa]|uniref:Uncharacterized protein n=1 Tax=Vespula squamosa TaxID=30214 RepID=A0ABD2BDU6_VESSQ